MKCEKCDNQKATYALPEDREHVYCSEHKTKEMIHIYTKKCAGKDDGLPCTKRPTYGLVGTKKGIYCKKHKEPEMIDVTNLKCAEDGCTKQPCFNLHGLKALYCGSHIKPGMVDVKNQQCLEDGCPLQPAYGFKGKKPIYCSSHKKDGMMDLKNIYCNECDTIASYGKPGGKPEYCLEHSSDGMMYVRAAVICLEEGCTKQASYGEEDGKLSHCSEHASPGMIDLHHSKCEHPSGCPRNPSFGFPREKARFCVSHMLEGMVNVVSKSCEVQDCPERARYNFQGLNPCFCRRHMTPTMINVANPYCKLCHNTQVGNDKYKGYCLRCFIYTFPDVKISRHYRIKERHVHDFLEKHYNTKFIYNKPIDGGCSMKQPDWFFECLTHSVIVECDENKHSSYETTCEIQRINDLYTDLGDRPIVFIRFNPDEYMDKNGDKVKSSFKYHDKLDVPVIRNEKEWNNRLNALKNKIDHHIAHVPTEKVITSYLFYDEV